MFTFFLLSARGLSLQCMFVLIINPFIQILTCFITDYFIVKFSQIEAGSTYFLGKIYKSGEDSIRVGKIRPSGEEMFDPDQERINVGRQLICPEITIEEASDRKRRNATIMATITEVSNLTKI